MKKSKYSLKKVYESVFKNHKTDIVKEFKDSSARNVSKSIVNAKTLKDLYYKPANDDALPANDVDIINQTISTEIPGLGTFDLTPVQIGLIGCADQYFYGDKQLALNLINVLKTGQSIESEVVNQRVGLAASVNESNKSKKEKSKKEKIKLDINHARKFLNHCKSEGILDEDYNINEDKQIVIFDDYFIPSSAGYLFELFLCFNIKEKFSTKQINIYESQERLSSYENVKYISSILKIIYNLFDLNKLEDAWNEEDHFKLYKKLFNPEPDIFEVLISSNTDRNDLFFEFLGSKAAIDIYVRKNNGRGEIIAALDLKTSAVGRVHKSISGSTEHLDSQIASIIKQNKKNEEINNFVIGLLNVTYAFDKEGIKIKSNSDITCKYLFFNTDQSDYDDYNNYYEKCIDSESKDFKFTEELKYLTLQEKKIKPINFDIKNIAAMAIEELYIERANNQNVNDLKSKIDEGDCSKGKIGYISQKYSYFEPEEFDELIRLLTKKYPDVLDKKKFKLIKKAFETQKYNKEFKRLPAHKRLFILIKNVLDRQGDYWGVLINNIGSFNNKSTALGKYFHDNPQEISKVCDLVYDYTNTDFIVNLNKGPYYKKFLETFYDYVINLNESIEKKELNPADEKAKDVLSKINFYNWDSGINYPTLETDEGLKEYSINMFVKKVLNITKNNISMQTNTIFKILILTGQNEYEKSDDTTTSVTDIEISLGRYFKQNPHDLVDAYNKLFNEIKTMYGKENANFSFYNRILVETYKSVLNQLEGLDRSKEELTKEKLMISNIEVERLRQIDIEKYPEMCEELKKKSKSALNKALRSNKNVRVSDINGEVGARHSRARLNDKTFDLSTAAGRTERGKAYREVNSHLGEYFYNNPDLLLKAYCEVVDFFYSEIIKESTNKVCIKFLELLYTEVAKVINKSSNDPALSSELEKKQQTLKVKDDYKDVIIDDIVVKLYNREEKDPPKNFNTPSGKSAWSNQLTKTITDLSGGDIEIINAAIESYKSLPDQNPEFKKIMLNTICEHFKITGSGEPSTSDPSPDETNDSVYIPGNVISERLSKKKTLKEVYRHLF